MGVAEGVAEIELVSVSDLEAVLVPVPVSVPVFEVLEEGERLGVTEAEAVLVGVFVPISEGVGVIEAVADPVLDEV